MSDILRDTEQLAPGDVCLVAIQLRDKRTGDTFWWKSFRCVGGFPLVGSRRRRSRNEVTFLRLKMQPDMERDLRTIDLTDPHTVVTKLEPEQWPPGVVAMRMKALSMGWIRLD